MEGGLRRKSRLHTSVQWESDCLDRRLACVWRSQALLTKICTSAAGCITLHPLTREDWFMSGQRFTVVSDYLNQLWNKLRDLVCRLIPMHVLQHIKSFIFNKIHFGPLVLVWKARSIPNWSITTLLKNQRNIFSVVFHISLSCTCTCIDTSQCYIIWEKID